MFNKYIEMANPSTFLSIIFPAHNEEQRISHALDEAINFIKSSPYSIEIIVVENGSSDKTLQIALDYAKVNPEVLVIHEINSGKGLAVKSGMLAAHGKFRFICDVDLAMPITEIIRFIPPQLNGIDIAIGSREANGAIRYNEPKYRHILGRVFNFIVRIILLPSLQDTQCGFKCFTSEAAKNLFTNLVTMGWAFDIEILVKAQYLGYKIAEIGIPWYFIPGSKIHIFRDSFRMIIDLLKIKMNSRLWNRKI